MQNKDIRPTNDKHQPHGYWERYYNDGNFWYHSYFVNRQPHGFDNDVNKWYEYHAK
jgi:hypothetical protein